MTLDDHTSKLRKVLLGLKPTGAAGFEGLLAVVLTSIADVPFRLARSGSQFGVDGKSVYSTDGICFEGKRYDKKIPRTEVLSKIAELSLRESDVDLWVLGATTEVGSQLADDVKALADRSGISTFVLDWSDTGLPPLAVAIAMADAAFIEFLKKRGKDVHVIDNAEAALSAVRKDDGFSTHSSRIHELLLSPASAPRIAMRANTHWLEEVFSSKIKARRHLGQPLAPGDDGSSALIPRDGLVGQLASLLSMKPDGKVAVILGEEGNGKSWLFAQSWLSAPEKPLMIVMTADDFSESVSGITELFINKLITQTAAMPSVAASNRWLRKFESWAKAGVPEVPRLVVVVDGLNQRPTIDWARKIEAIADELGKIGGRLIVTSRTAYYSNQIEKRLYSQATEVLVPEWTDAERDSILATHGIQATSLHPKVASSLRNPRLLGIALELLKREQINELEDLGVSRLLFEHMRSHERDAPVPRPAQEFARTLQSHAQEILARVAIKKMEDLDVFNSSLEAVSDGRFFLPLEGDSSRYRLHEDGLTLALGFSVLDELRKALRNSQNVPEVLGALLEPISALDRTADVMIAALTVSCLDDKCPTEIGSAIVSVFADLQNPDVDLFPSFAALAERRSDVFMQAAEQICLAGARQANFDWIEATLINATQSEAAWVLMTPVLQSWLGFYSLSPDKRIPRRDPTDNVEKERADAQAKIDAAMDALSAAELEVLDTLTRRDVGDLDVLSRFAFRLMAGKSLAPLAAAFVRWCFANALNSSPWTPYKEFTQLLRLNNVDWPEARMALLLSRFLRM